MDRLSKALDPLRIALNSKRSKSARKVAIYRDVALMCLLSSALRRPDRSQAVGYITGFKVVGNLETPSVFRGRRPSTCPASSARPQRRNCGSSCVPRLRRTAS